MKKFVINVLVLFVVSFVIDFLWNAVFFAKFNFANFGSIARVENGVIVPLFGYVILADVLMAVGIAYFVPLGLNAHSPRRVFVGRGILLSIVIFGIFEAVNHALLSVWPLRQVAVDMISGLVDGGVMGIVLSYLPRRS